MSTCLVSQSKANQLHHKKLYTSSKKNSCAIAIQKNVDKSKIQQQEENYDKNAKDKSWGEKRFYSQENRPNVWKRYYASFEWDVLKSG